MTAGAARPICGADLRPSFVLPGLSVRRRAACGHRVADHDRPAGADSDYHAQYEEGAFLESLRATGWRQAELLVAGSTQPTRDQHARCDLGLSQEDGPRLVSGAVWVDKK